VPSDLSNIAYQPVTGVVSPITELVNLSFSPACAPGPCYLTAYYPFAAVYELVSAAGTATLNTLPLQLISDSEPPVGGPIGGFSVSAANLCGSIHSGYANLMQPTSAFFILQYATTGSCTSPTTVLINYTDLSTNSGTTLGVSVPTAYYADLYSIPSGNLYAEVLQTGGYGGDLSIYYAPPSTAGAPPSFTSPTAVATSVASVEHHPIHLSRSGQASSTVLFDKVVGTSFLTTLYRIDTSGNAPTSVFTTSESTVFETLQVGPFDDSNIYFADVIATNLNPGGTAEPGPPIQYNFYEAPISCNGTTVACTAIQIGTVTEPQSGEPLSGTAGIPYGTTFSMVDSNGTNLILASTNLTTGEGMFTFGLYTLSVSPPTSGIPTPAAFATTYQGESLTAFLDYVSGYLFVNETASDGSMMSLAFPPSGPVPTWALPIIDDSFVQWLPAIVGGPTDSTVLQLTGIPTAGPSLGVESADVINLAGGVPQPVLQANASSLTNYMVPAGYSIVNLAAPVSNTIGQGTLVVPSGLNYGLAINVSNDRLLTIQPPDNYTTLTPFDFSILAPFNANLFSF